MGAEFRSIVIHKDLVPELSSSQIFHNRIEREWLSTEEAAYFLSISENALRIMVHRNQIRAYKFGRRLRFKLQDYQALFQRKGA
jgi:excisionase family DNA binding protein